MPYDVHVNDFLHRFLANSGPGPHHLTFKVPDLREAIERARRFGLEPIGIDLNDPEWIEAFIHPKQATGVVVQLAQAPKGWSSPPPDDYPTGRRQRRDGRGPVAAASLLRVTHAVADFDAATALFVGLLGGTVVSEGVHADHRWADLAWEGPLGLRLVSPTDQSSMGTLVQWLGGRAGRIHHLELAVAEPDSLPDIEPVSPSLSWVQAGSSGRWVIQPESNRGLRLVVGAA
jgi:methylmalonyl-CoA/ethylmalonyl-CoA epimerase